MNGARRGGRNESCDVEMPEEGETLLLDCLPHSIFYVNTNVAEPWPSRGENDRSVYIIGTI